MTKNKELIFLHSQQETEALGIKIAKTIKPPAVVFLEGNLGAGKTTVVRGFLQALGYDGVVKSPTFTIVETYEFPHCLVAHFDLYRIKSPLELQAVGFRDYFSDDTICLIEWADRILDILPKPTLLCKLKISSEKKGRIAALQWL